jgi:hypothetical protein
MLVSIPLIFASQPTCNSGPVPAVVPICNATLQNQILRRGAALAIGSSPQEFAFNTVGYEIIVHMEVQVSLTFGSALNNTVIFDGTGLCASDISPIQCTGYHGGAFDQGSP